MEEDVKKIGSNTSEGRLKIYKIEEYEYDARNEKEDAIYNAIISAMFAGLTIFMASEIAPNKFGSMMLTGSIVGGVAAIGTIIEAIIKFKKSKNLENKINALEEEILTSGTRIK